MKIVYTRRTLFELEEIGAYIAARNPQAATRVRTAIRRSVNLLRAFPRRGRKQKSRNVYRIGAGKYPYHIFYRFDAATRVVTVLSIYHTARRPRHKNT